MRTCHFCGRSDATNRLREASDVAWVCDACAWLASRSDAITVSPLSESDLELVLAWRSHPSVYRHFKSQDGPLAWENHVEWFENREPERFDYVIRFDGRRVGVVSIDSNDYASIYIGDISARNEGVAATALQWLVKRVADERDVRAEIHEDNDPSLSLFRKCGFERVGRDGEWLQFKYFHGDS